MEITPVLEYADLGRIAYDPALALQRRLVERVRAAPRGPSYLLLLEHDPPVVTLGRRGRDEHLLVDRARLAEEGIEVHESQRGGDVTFHGPGQLVAYPIVRLDPRRRTVHDYVWRLEESLIRLLAGFGLEGRRREGYTGVWAGEEKVAAIGVAVQRWVAFHGLALNVGSDLSGFDRIVPCGIRGPGVTSLSRLLGREAPMTEAKRALLEAFSQVFAFEEPREAAPEILGLGEPSG